MQSISGQRWLIVAVALGMWTSIAPVGADTISEALPAAESQPVSQGAKSQAKPKTKEKATAAAPTSGDASEEEGSNDEGPNDPLEPLNRLIFAVNDLLDFVIIRPVAEIYRAITPEPLRDGIRNALDNLFTPVAFLNHVLQGEPERATATLFRFLVNSTIGGLGLGDAASEMGYPRYDTDFNQTLTAWNMDAGPYLVLPLIGSSSFRGGIGLVGDYFADPLNLYLMNRHHRRHRYWLTVRYGLDMVSHREKLIETIDNLRKGSLDMYVTMRSIYFQRQAYMAEKLKSKNAPEKNNKGGRPNTP